MLEVLSVLTGIGGAILNAKLKVSGFYLWLVSNVILFVLSVSHGLYGIALLQTFYAGTCIYGICQWNNAAEVKDAPEKNLTGRISHEQSG